MASSIKETLDSMMSNLKTMVDSNAVIGDAVTLPDGTIIIPISKINYGFASGGGNATQVTKNGLDGIGAGGGGGITITPVAFLSVKDGVTKLLQIEPFVSPVDRVIEKMPDVLDKVGGFIDTKASDMSKKRADKKAEKQAAKEAKQAAKALEFDEIQVADNK